MMLKHEAEYLRDQLEPMLPDNEVTAVPWHNEGPRDEWIVTVWTPEGDVLADVFLTVGRYLLRKAGRGKVLGEAKVNPDSLAAVVKNISRQETTA